MEQKNHNHNGFGNGFVLGLLIGVIVTLLVTTKKGRELFKEFTEKGLDKFSDLEKKLQKTASNAASQINELEELDDESEYVASEPRQTRSEPPKEIRQVTKLENHSNGNESHKQSRPHRFFRSKKS